jgi:hypothetical protein
MIGWSGNAIPRRNPMPHLCTPAVLQCQTSCQKWAGLNACVWILRYHCTTPARLTGGKEQLTSFHCVGFIAEIGKKPRENFGDPCRSLGLKRRSRLCGRPSGIVPQICLARFASGAPWIHMGREANCACERTNPKSASLPHYASSRLDYHWHIYRIKGL